MDSEKENTALIAIVGGLYLTFFHSQGFVRTQATIVDVRDISTDTGASYLPTVEYTVNGQTYRQELDTSSDSYKVGKVINVLYDPNDPSVVHGGGFLGVYFMVAGAAILAIIIVTEIKKKASLKQVKALHAENGGNGSASRTMSVVDTLPIRSLHVDTKVEG